MKVFKFGGASVSTAERIRNVAGILRRYKGEKLLIIVSAMGKTTNALEKVAEAFYNGNKKEALQLFSAVKESHDDISSQLLGAPFPPLVDFYTEIEWLLHDKPVRDYDYYYDQLVCVGELLSSAIVSHFLNSVGIPNQWIDVRDVVRTDNNFRDARIEWTVTGEKVNTQVKPVFQHSDIVLTQGFIGATDENESTTLGREGSDFSAAIFANLLDAERQVIWKDVQGVMNADPKQYAEAQWIKELNYREVIEMAFYGAQVIHPKTIKPLQNKGIPLYVKSFLNPDDEGTCIHNQTVSNLPPIIVYKAGQVLVQLSSRNFSFVSEGLTEEVYAILSSLNLKPNLTQNAAISLLCVLDDRADKVEAFALNASEKFDVTVKKDLTLLTIRHCTEELINRLTTGFTVVLRQQTPETVQLLLEMKA
ncbi:MAG: aspartate kinase [Bacteroidota bacterium]|nr:aspartate kinase [Bacteroidota bacterium]